MSTKGNLLYTAGLVENLRRCYGKIQTHIVKPRWSGNNHIDFMELMCMIISNIAILTAFLSFCMTFNRNMIRCTH